MGCRGFVTSTSKQRRKPGHNQSFHPPLLYFWRTYWHERKVCRKGDRSAWCLARTKWKNSEWKLCSLPPPWHPNPSPSLSCLFSFSFALAAFVVFHPLLHPQLLFFFFLSSSLSLSSSCSPQLFFHLSPIRLVLCISLVLSQSRLFLTQLPSHVSLPPPFFMSFWPRSHFPNWLSGSLIIPRHPCCRLFYLSACRRPNPLISKHPSSAHTASQQPTAFPVYFSTVHTDGPSTSSRQAQHRMTLRAAQVKDPLENSSGILMDQKHPEFVQPSTLTPPHQFGGEML